MLQRNCDCKAGNNKEGIQNAFFTPQKHILWCGCTIHHLVGLTEAVPFPCSKFLCVP